MLRTRDFTCGLKRPQDGSSSTSFSFSASQSPASRCLRFRSRLNFASNIASYGSAGFNSLRAGLLLSRKVWMFDNEIDWVTHLENWLLRREARKLEQDSEGVYIQGRAQAMSYREITQASVQVRRVSLGEAATTCVSMQCCSQGGFT